ncbi:MAG: acetyl-CoA C-acyltransferase [Hyphomicrobiaceae bacterium TMED74]|nr:acetyl-CoA C-acyltransferase [Filomicrobium sp.]RPG45033.1 MAG: acetyl-CoA C-acyltransferase [Hyphomicrobiaceae bacterium TMED74]
MSGIESDPIVIVSGARTPMGSFQGSLQAMTAPQLGSAAVKAAVEGASIAPEDVSEVLMGCVLPAGQGQAPARQAAFGAGLPESVPCTTVNKMCGSGMKTVMMAFDALHAREKDIIVAGGLESMTNTPHILPKMRSGQRLGHSVVQDHMFIDGLEDAYDKGRLMGTFAEDTAQHYQFTREAQDAFAVESLTRAKKANEDGSFANEITSVNVKSRKGETEISNDEQPFSADLAKIPTLRPAFREGGTVTAANSSSISDGAAAVVMMRLSEAERRGLKSRAKIVSTSSNAQAPQWFTTAPIGATQKVLDATGWSVGDVGLFEINEAFAVVAMAAMRDLDIPHDKVNVHGGACALGHPVGASGTRIIVTLLNAMEKYGQDKGIASLCIGGGEATAVAIERMN